eukprot:Sro595_g172620.1 Ankyrin Repeat (164) ;mRNA; r:20115-20606
MIRYLICQYPGALRHAPLPIQLEIDIAPDASLENMMMLVRPYPLALLENWEAMEAKLQAKVGSDRTVVDSIHDFALLAQRECALKEALEWLNDSCKSMEDLLLNQASTRRILHECTVPLEPWLRSQYGSVHQELQVLSTQLDEMVEEAWVLDLERSTEGIDQP